MRGPSAILRWRRQSAGASPAAPTPGAGARRPVPGAGGEALHVAGLWAVAVAQPLFDLLSRSPEFFVAHETRPGDILALVALLCLAGPAGWLAVLRLCRRIHPRLHAAAAGVGVGVLTAAVALAAVKQAAAWSAEASFGVAAVCGALAGAGYVRAPAIRLFATFLSPAAIVAPAVFLLQPAIAPLLSAPRGGGPPLAAIDIDDPPPVAVVVFDQLPLVSLLNRDGAVDRGLYPNFAALADEATWFRNASAVSGWTQWALPAILTGHYPAPGRLPVARDHPDNLFTLLGSRYRLHVLEPLTGMCPETLCATHRPRAAVRLAAMLSDLSVVYLHAVLPHRLTDRLPPVTSTWRDFAADDSMLGRWNAHRERDRAAMATDYIASITPPAGDARPPLHFMHVLLPHEPWVYLPDGRRHTWLPHLVGAAGDEWLDDGWAVTLDYQRHLLQVRHADTLLGALLERLRAAGLRDDALIVVTADHGASVRPGTPFRVPTRETFADVAAVPLFIKRPGQRQGGVADTNVETIDILPTIAAALGVRLPWSTDGSNVLAAGRPARPAKTMFRHEARDPLHAPGDLGAAIARSVAHKYERFENGDPARPRLGGHDAVVGLPAAELVSDRLAPFDVVIDTLPALRDVDPEGRFVPARIIGGVLAREGRAALAPLAVAVNGVVAAVTRVYSFPAFGHALPWEVLVDPALLRPGANDVGVFAIERGPTGAPVLHEAPEVASHRRAINLIAPEAAEVRRDFSGFLPAEWNAHGRFRWTDGAARLSVGIDPRSPPAALAVRIRTTGPQKSLRIAVNGCEVFDGPIFGRWEQTFPLDACRLDASMLEIALRSNVHVESSARARRLGVGVAAIELIAGGPAR